MKIKLADIADTKISDVLDHDHKGTTNKVYAAVQKKARQIHRLDMLSTEEKTIIRDYLKPAIEAIKLPDVKATVQAREA